MLKRTIEGVAQGIAYLRKSSDDVVLDLKPRLQLDGHSCGMQSLAAILDYYDFEIDYDDLEETIGLNEDGCDEDQLRKAIRAWGLKHRSIRRMTLSLVQECINNEHPLLVAPRGTHWSVIYGYGDGVIYLMDPLPGRALRRAGKYDAETFLGSWNRWGIEVFEPSAKRRRKSNPPPKRARRKTG